MHVARSEQHLREQAEVHPCATLALCHARQQALVVRPRLRGRARARITPPPPPRCAAPLHARIVAGFRTHTARRLRHLPILSASAPLRRPGRWRRDQCMKMEDDGSCAHEMDPRTRGAPRPGPPGRRRQTVTAAAGGRRTRDKWARLRRCGEGVERERRGSVILV